MATTTFTSREFNQDSSRAKRASQDGPVFITDRGRPAHVLMTIEDYRRLARSTGNVAECLAMPDGDDIEFDPPRLEFNLKVPEF